MISYEFYYKIFILLFIFIIYFSDGHKEQEEEEEEEENQANSKLVEVNHTKESNRASNCFMTHYNLQSYLPIE